MNYQLLFTPMNVRPNQPLIWLDDHSPRFLTIGVRSAVSRQVLIGEFHHGIINFIIVIIIIITRIPRLNGCQCPVVEAFTLEHT